MLQNVKFTEEEYLALEALCFSANESEGGENQEFWDTIMAKVKSLTDEA